MEKNNINHLFYTNKQYPNKLKLCTDSPINLYYKSNINWNNQRFLSIVGTRKSTQFGKEYTQNLISNLAQYNVVIVSGLAFGIDIAAHKSALHNGLNTVDALAHVDEIKEKLQWHSSKIAKHLLQMESKDIIIAFSGKIYKRRM